MNCFYANTELLWIVYEISGFHGGDFSVLAQCNVVYVYLPTRLYGFITQKTSYCNILEHSNAISFLQPESKHSEFGRSMLLSNKILHDTDTDGEMTKYKKR
jgi:hypothetical protein